MLPGSSVLNLTKHIELSYGSALYRFGAEVPVLAELGGRWSFDDKSGAIRLRVGMKSLSSAGKEEDAKLCCSHLLVTIRLAFGYLCGEERAFLRYDFGYDDGRAMKPVEQHR